MNHSSLTAPNLFAFVPHHSPNVVGFLYWLCAWADPRFKQVSEELHLAGVTMLQSLMCGIGGAKMDSFSQVDLVKHYGSECEEVCFFRVNGTHALLLSDTQAPDDGRDGNRAGYWGDDGLTLVAVCCEELPVCWQRVETETFTLAAWESDPGIRYLSLANLSVVLGCKARAHYSIHPVLDEFHRALMGVVDAEQQFGEIQPEQWNQHAWRGFYKLVAASFGGKFFETAGRHETAVLPDRNCATRYVSGFGGFVSAY